MSQPASEPVRVIARNKRARHEYHLLDELECGIELRGTEVKSLREGRCSLAEAWVGVRSGELWIVGMHIPEYRHGSAFNHEPTRDRRLLAHRREIDKWAKAVQTQGVTIVPVELYFRGSRVKLRIALAKGKRLHDKREASREREAAREIERARARRR